MRRHMPPVLPSRLGLSHVEVVVTICVIGLLAALFVPATRSTRGSAQKLECQSHLKQIALAVNAYVAANNGRIPHLEDGQFGWPVALLPYLDNAAFYRALQKDPHLVETESKKLGTPFEIHIKVLACPLDQFKSGKHVALSYAANAGWGRFLADSNWTAPGCVLIAVVSVVCAVGY